MLKVGCIDFINMLPATYRMGAAFPVELVRFVFGHPARINALALEGELEVASVSSAFYLDNKERFELLPGPTISSFGPVDSVLYVYKPDVFKRFSSLRVVPVTEQSATSVKLLCWWLQQRQMPLNQIQFCPYPASSWQGQLNTYDNALLIGDEALRFYHGAAKEGLEVVDLAQAWSAAHAGLPMVFGVWVAKKQWALAYPDTVKAIAAHYQGLIHENLAMPRYRQRLIQRASQKAQLPETVFLEYWCERLHYGWDSQHEQSLECFRNATESLSISLPSTPLSL